MKDSYLLTMQGYKWVLKYAYKGQKYSATFQDRPNQAIVETTLEGFRANRDHPDYKQAADLPEWATE